MCNCVLWTSNFCKIRACKIIKLISAFFASVSIVLMNHISMLTSWANSFPLPFYVTKIDPTFCHAICQIYWINSSHNLGIKYNENIPCYLFQLRGYYLFLNISFLSIIFCCFIMCEMMSNAASLISSGLSVSRYSSFSKSTSSLFEVYSIPIISSKVSLN